MTWLSSLTQEIIGLAHSGRAAEIFHGNSRAARQLREGENLFELVRNPTRTTANTLRRLLTAQGLARVQEDINRYTPNSAQVNRCFEILVEQTDAFGTYERLRWTHDGSIVSTILEADHFIEARVHRMLRDGPLAHAARSTEWAQISTDAQRIIEKQANARHLYELDPVGDAFAGMVPANGIVTTSLVREWGEHLGTHPVPLLYSHQGYRSKTWRMADIIPYRTEGNLTYREHLDLARALFRHEYGFPRFVEEALQQDLIDSIMDAVANPQARDLVLEGVPGARRLRTEEAIRRRLEAFLDIDTQLPRNYLENRRLIPPVLPYRAQLEVIEEGVRDLLGRSFARARTP